MYAAALALEFARILVIGLVYLTPFWLAARRQHPQKVSILILNLLLGWTIIGWIAALIWALAPQAPITAEDRLSDDEKIVRFADLRDRGLITEGEFTAKKREILGF